MVCMISPFRCFTEKTVRPVFPLPVFSNRLDLEAVWCMMGAMRVHLAVAAFCCLALSAGVAQDKAEPAPAKADGATDVLFLQDRTEVRGEIIHFSASGRLKVRV